MTANALIQNLKASVRPIWCNPQIGIMLVIVTLVMSGVGLVTPILAVYAKTLAASSTLAGMVITIFGAGRLIANYPAGSLSQKYGRRNLLGAGLVIVAAGSVGAALASSIEWLVLWRFAQGVGSGVYMTVSAAAMADLAQEDDRGSVLALQQAAMLLGSSLGPGIGGLLAQRLGLSAPFWAYGAVAAVAAIIVWCCLGETVGREDEQTPCAISQEPHARLLDQPLFASLCTLYLGIFFTRTASQWMLIPSLAISHYQFGVDVIGLAQTALAAGTFLILPLSGNLIRRIGAGKTTVYSIITMAGALVLLGVVGNSALFWISFTALGIGIGISSPAISVMSVEILPRARSGSGMGILRSFGDVGFILGPLVVGILDDLGSVGVIGGLLLNALLLGLLIAIFQHCDNNT